MSAGTLRQTIERLADEWMRDNDRYRDLIDDLGPDPHYGTWAVASRDHASRLRALLAEHSDERPTPEPPSGLHACEGCGMELDGDDSRQRCEDCAPDVDAETLAEVLFYALDEQHDGAWHVHASECCWSFPGAIDALTNALAAFRVTRREATR